MRPVALAAVMAWTLLAAPSLRALDGMPPETDDVRRAYLELAQGPLWQLAEHRPRVEPSFESGRDVLVTTESNERYRYLVFIPESDGEYPVDRAGAYILRRRRSDGGLDQLKVFLHSHPGFFIRIVPDADGSRSRMSVFLAGVELHRDVTLPVSVPTLLAEPFERIVGMTRSLVDWSLVFPPLDDPGHRTVELMAARARSMLHTLPDAEDGAMDEHGNLVLIDSLVLQDQDGGFNCSGFAKWIVDGLVRPLSGSYLAIEPLKTKHLEVRGTRWTQAVENVRDPYFGLDWTRNLATALLSAHGADRGALHPEAADVRDVPYASYVEDVGYPVARLPQILYLLAVTEPGHVYLASLNREFGTDPPLNQHVHVAVLFPYVDEEGRFTVSVMERNVETSLESLDRRYHTDRVHLVRLQADRAFAPPVIRDW